MKRITIVILIVIALMLLMSCKKSGTVVERRIDKITIDTIYVYKVRTLDGDEIPYMESVYRKSLYVVGDTIKIPK